MPFTPFHFGPGLLVKGVAARWFSWTAFVASNVLIDVESFYYLMHDDWPVHRRLHTFVGAGVAGIVTALAMLTARRVLPALRVRLDAMRPSTRAEASPLGIVIGALAGALTHPLLDGIMHADIQPFQPWTAANPLHLIISVKVLHQACLGAALAGAVLVYLWRRRETVTATSRI